MQRRVVQQGFAIGFAGLVGVIMVPGSASGGAALPEPEGAAGAALLEPLAWQAMMPAEGSEEETGLSSSIDQASPMEGGIYTKYECTQAPYNCPSTTRCAFPSGSSICQVTNCGDGACGMCPSSVSKLLFDGWCSYGCMRVTEMVGGAFILRLSFGGGTFTTPFCIDKGGKIYKDGKVFW